jgi:hypothetical protein
VGFGNSDLVRRPHTIICIVYIKNAIVKKVIEAVGANAKKFNLVLSARERSVWVTFELSVVAKAAVNMFGEQVLKYW